MDLALRLHVCRYLAHGVVGLGILVDSHGLVLLLQLSPLSGKLRSRCHTGVTILLFILKDEGQNKEAHASKGSKEARQHTQPIAPGQIVHPRSRHPVTVIGLLSKHQGDEEHQECTSQHESAVDEEHSRPVLVEPTAYFILEVEASEDSSKQVHKEGKHTEGLNEPEPSWLEIVLDGIKLRRMDPPAADVTLHDRVLGHDVAVETDMPQADAAEGAVHSRP